MKRRTLVQCLTITIEELRFLEIWIKTQISSDNRSAADLAKKLTVVGVLGVRWLPTQSA